MTQRQVNGVNGLHQDSLESNHIHLKGVNGNANGTTNGNGVKSETRKKMDRKKSSPMMPTFMVSAPGKVIVCGEHAVVHGKVRFAPL
jgi:mevalonate kinase